MKKVAMFLVLAGLVALFFVFDLGQYLTLSYIKAEQANLAQAVAADPVTASLVYFGVYVLVTALSLPGAAIMTLAGGAIFGLWWGLALVSFASTLGATLAMLVARYLLRDQVIARFDKSMKRIDQGIEKDGAFYLFTLRLVPAFPFFVINLVMGLTSIPVLTFFIVSQIGMLAGTVVFVNAGTQLGQIESLAGILSAELIGSFVLLGIFPLLAKKIVDFSRASKLLKAYPRPKKYDRDVVVLGAGSGGLVAALIVATVKGRVTLIERHKMGGDCLNTGCVPSKSLIRSAKLAHDMSRAADIGLKSTKPEFEFSDVMERVQRIIKTIEPHDSVERFESLGVNCEMGEARILSPFCVEVNGKQITTRSIIVATGARPLIPDLPGLDQVDYLTSDNLWEIRDQPQQLVVLGGGPIGSELTQSFARLGSQVTQVEAQDRILTREDLEVTELVMDRFRAEGVNLLTQHRAVAVEKDEAGPVLVVETQAGDQRRLPFDALLIALGRKANVTGFGLEELGVRITDKGTIEVDEYLRTNIPNIFAVGDVAGPYQFTHTASHMAWYAAVNALFGHIKKFAVDYSVVPWTTFTSPEVARVGLSEAEAIEQGIAHEVTTYSISGLDRALADEEAYGLVRVLTPPGKDKILGATIVSDHAGDLLAEYVLAMKHGLGLGKIMGTIHTYPTLSEMNKFAASEWRKANKPDWALDLAGKYFAWRRG